MSITSSRTIQVQFSGDVTLDVIQSAAENITSPGDARIVTLSAGNNTITPPTISGLLATGLTIIPPVGNSEPLRLKGDTDDIGIPLHTTDPTSLGLDDSLTSIIINVSTTVVGVRLIWS